MPSVASRIIFNLSLLLMELADSGPGALPARSPGTVAYNRIRKIQQYVLAHDSRTGHIADLAQEVNMSASGLRFFARAKTMRHWTGRYIRQTRIACACDLMNATDLALARKSESNAALRFIRSAAPSNR